MFVVVLIQDGCLIPLWLVFPCSCGLAYIGETKRCGLAYIGETKRTACAQICVAPDTSISSHSQETGIHIGMISYKLSLEEMWVSIHWRDEENAGDPV